MEKIILLILIISAPHVFAHQGKIHNDSGLKKMRCLKMFWLKLICHIKKI